METWAGKKDFFQGFLLFSFGKNYDSAVSVSGFKRKNRISILLHAESEKWMANSPHFETSELHAERNYNIGTVPSRI
jgi:hypothetical protein